MINCPKRSCCHNSREVCFYNKAIIWVGQYKWEKCGSYESGDNFIGQNEPQEIVFCCVECKHSVPLKDSTRYCGKDDISIILLTGGKQRCADRE